MKKIYTFAAFACAALAASAQAIDIDNLTDSQIEGKYRVVSTATVLLGDVYIDEEPLVVLTKTAENTFDVNEFFLPVTDVDYNNISIGATWEPATDEAEANLNVQRDMNGEAYFYNPYAELNDTYWQYLWNENFRLLPSLTEDGDLQFSRPEDANPIVFQYYDYDARVYNDAFGWYNGFTLVKEPVFTTISKRNLAGTYVLTGWDGDGNAVSYEVTIAQDGTNYTLSGLFGHEDVAVTCTWDANNGGIRAKGTVEYDDNGFAASDGVGSYAPSETLYFSFTEDGRLYADYDLYGIVGGEYVYLFGVELGKGTIDGLKTATAQPSEARAYDLQGRVLSMQNRHAIAVKNGRKVLTK